MAKPTPFLKVIWQDKEITASVRLVEVEDNDRLVDEARITLQDPHGSGGAAIQPDQTIEIDLGWDSEHAVLFKGVVVNPANQAAADGGRTVTIVARDLSQLMNREPRTFTFPPGKLSTHIRTIRARHPKIGEGLIAADPDPEFTERRPLRQLNQRDYEFLQVLAERYGARAFVEVNDGQSKLYFVSNRRLLQADPLGKLQYCRGLRQLLEFNYKRVASRAAQQVSVTVHDPTTGETSTATGQVPETLPPPTLDPTHAAAVGRVDPSARAVYESAVLAGTTIPAPPVKARATGLDSDPARAERTTITDPTRVLGLRGEGRAVGTVKLRAKGKVTIEGIAPWAEGDWYVAKAVHVWRDTSTGERRGSSYETSFTATR